MLELMDKVAVAVRARKKWRACNFGHRMELEIMKRIVFTVLIFCASALPSLSYCKDTGFVFVSSGTAYGPGETVWIYESGIDGCFIYKKYIVKVSDYKEPGQNIEVYKRRGGKNEEVCGSTDSLQNILSIIPKDSYGSPGVKEFNGFYGIVKNKMFVDTGTYEFGRTLDVYDLDTGKKVYTSDYDHNVNRVKKFQIAFWRTRKGFKDPSECPNRISCEYGGRPELEEHIVLNLSDFKERVIAESCYCPA